MPTVNWTASTLPSYTDMGGFTFNHLASGQLVLPQNSPYAQSGYLWWSKGSNQQPIEGNNWWNGLEAIGNELELDDLGILNLKSPDAAYDYYLIFPEVDPTVFKTDYTLPTFPFFETVQTDDFDPTDFETINQFIKPEYQNLDKFSTDSYQSDVSTQINELLYIREEPDPSCDSSVSKCDVEIPEPSQILGFLVLGLVLMSRVIKRA